MATEVIMPRLAADMEEGTVAAWLKAEGEYVEKGAPLFNVESEKANVEMEAPASGVLAISVNVGTNVPCGTVIAVIAARDEVVTAAAPAAAPNGDGAGATRPAEMKPEAVNTESRLPHRATPAARRVAKELNVDLEQLHGSGPGGRVVEEDVRSYAAARGDAKPVAASESVQAAPAPVPA